MILLTREEAETVLGPSPTAPESALEPAPLMDGTYVLPEDVLDDPANADVYDFLVDHVVPGDPDPALVWDFGTPDNPNEHDIIAYNAAEADLERGRPATGGSRGGSATKDLPEALIAPRAKPT